MRKLILVILPLLAACGGAFSDPCADLPSGRVTVIIISQDPSCPYIGTRSGVFRGGPPQNDPGVVGCPDGSLCEFEGGFSKDYGVMGPWYCEAHYLESTRPDGTSLECGFSNYESGPRNESGGFSGNASGPPSRGCLDFCAGPPAFAYTGRL